MPGVPFFRVRRMALIRWSLSGALTALAALFLLCAFGVPGFPQPLDGQILIKLSEDPLDLDKGFFHGVRLNSLGNILLRSGAKEVHALLKIR